MGDHKNSKDIPRFRKPSILVRLVQVAILATIIYTIYWWGLTYGFIPETMRLF